MDKRASMYKRHRFPPEIIQYAVCLYHRFNLSARDIEDLMAERGITISYESRGATASPIAILPLTQLMTLVSTRTIARSSRINQRGSGNVA